MNSSLSGNLQVIFSASWCACRQFPGCVTRPWTRMQGCMPWTVSSKWQMSQWTLCNFTSSVLHFLGTCSWLSWHPSDMQSGSRSGKVDNVSPLPKLGSWTNEQEIANNPGCGSVVSRSSGRFLWTSVSWIVAKRIVRPWEPPQEERKGEVEELRIAPAATHLRPPVTSRGVVNRPSRRTPGWWD